MGGFNLNFSLPGLGIDAKKIQEALASYSARNAATGVPSARDFAPVVPGAGTAYAVSYTHLTLPTIYSV